MVLGTDPNQMASVDMGVGWGNVAKQDSLIHSNICVTFHLATSFRNSFRNFRSAQVMI